MKHLPVIPLAGDRTMKEDIELTEKRIVERAIAACDAAKIALEDDRYEDALLHVQAAYNETIKAGAASQFNARYCTADASTDRREGGT